MVDEQGWSGFARRPDVDRAALGAILRRVLGPGLRITRTTAGVAAQVYRVQGAEGVLYVRIAEEDHEDLSVDAALLEHLRAQGLHVPPVVHVEPFDQALGRSLLIMGEIPGADGQPVIDRVPGLDNAWVSAGHDGDGLLMAPATGQALATWITTGHQPKEVASFGLSRFDQPR